MVKFQICYRYIFKEVKFLWQNTYEIVAKCSNMYENVVK